MMRAFTSLGRAFLDFYAPQQCVFCDQPSGCPEALCDTCLAEFRYNDQACPLCGLPDCADSPCPGCLAEPPPLRHTRAPLVYDAAVALLIKRWKYDRDRNIAQIAAKVMASSPFIAEDSDIAIPVPLHWRRRLLRGFNQSGDLLEHLRERVPGLDAAHDRGIALHRTRATAKQSLAHTRRDRLRNLERAFSVQGDVTGRSILLVDDVCTTGATARAAARVLLRAGARHVDLWCLARTPETADGSDARTPG